jgi:hypothetical protein
MDDEMHSKHPHWAIRNANHTITWNNGLSKINIASGKTCPDQSAKAESHTSDIARTSPKKSPTFERSSPPK